MAVKALADGLIKLVELASAPADTSAITSTEANAGTDISGYVQTSDYKLGPTGSTTLTEKPLNVKGDINVPVKTQYQGNQITLFRHYDATSLQPDDTADATFDSFRTKGGTHYLIERRGGKDSGDTFTDGDEYSYYVVVTDDPQPQQPEGYVKYTVPLYVQSAVLNAIIDDGSA
jgi:hypothetical protein